MMMNPTVGPGVGTAGDCRSAAASPFSSPSRIPGLPDDLRQFWAFVSKVKREPPVVPTLAPAAADAAGPAARELFPAPSAPLAATKPHPAGNPANAALPPRTPASRMRKMSMLTPPSERSLAAKDEASASASAISPMLARKRSLPSPGDAMTPLSLYGDRRSSIPADEDTDSESENVDVTSVVDMGSEDDASEGDTGLCFSGTTAAASQPAERFYCTFPGCTKSFCRAYSLKYHQYTHYDNAPFACPEPGCGKKFSHQSRLNRHLFSHHPDERSFPCDYPGCTKRFSQKCHLKIHQITHQRKRARLANAAAAAAPPPGDTSDGFISDV